MLGRSSAAEIVQVTNVAGPLSGLSEVIGWTCRGVRGTPGKSQNLGRKPCAGEALSRWTR
jgi:hypothetical protein